MQFKRWLEHDLASELQNLYNQDQSERQRYQKYLTRFSSWQQAADGWAKDTGRDSNDIFADKERLQKAKQLIIQNIQQIKTPTLIKMAWLLVQHMDDDISFQKWFLDRLEKGTTEWKYLSDRISIAQGMPQKFGTQNENGSPIVP
jgi:LPS O-antigen subunit length determinant protein (WzzB/FepE family)